MTLTIRVTLAAAAMAVLLAGPCAAFEFESLDCDLAAGECTLDDLECSQELLDVDLVNDDGLVRDDFVVDGVPNVRSCGDFCINEFNNGNLRGDALFAAEYIPDTDDQSSGQCRCAVETGAGGLSVNENVDLIKLCLSDFCETFRVVGGEKQVCLEDPDTNSCVCDKSDGCECPEGSNECGMDDTPCCRFDSDGNLNEFPGTCPDGLVCGLFSNDDPPTCVTCEGAERADPSDLIDEVCGVESD